MSREARVLTIVVLTVAFAAAIREGMRVDVDAASWGSLGLAPRVNGRLRSELEKTKIEYHMSLFVVDTDLRIEGFSFVVAATASGALYHSSIGRQLSGGIAKEFSRTEYMSLRTFESLIRKLEDANVWSARTDGTHDGLNEMITIRCGDRAHAARWRVERPHLNKSLRNVIANSIIHQELQALRQSRPNILKQL